MLNHHTEGLHKNQIGPPEDSHLDNVEFADNPEARCPVVLIVDTSSSMTGEPIARVNEAIADFRTEISKDKLVFLRADVSLVAFNHETQEYDFASVNKFNPPPLEASGGTRMCSAIHTALDLLERRKQEYRKEATSYYRPIAMLLTDGNAEHDSEEEITSVGERIAREEEGRHVAFFSFGVDGANTEALERITPTHRPPMHIGDSRNIEGLFRWLSNSVAIVSTSQPGDKLTLDPVEGYLDY